MKGKRVKIIDILETYDEVAGKTAGQFFANHGLPQIEERVTFGYLSDFGASRPLLHTLITIFDLDWLKFVRFYEGIYRRREVPHYEDALALAAVMLSALSIFLSPVIGVEYAKWRMKQEKEKPNIAPQDLQQLLDFFSYLIKAFALREAYYKDVLSQEEFHKLREIVEQTTLEPAYECPSDLQRRIEAIWEAFNKKARFRLDKHLIEELQELAIKQSRQSEPIPPHIEEPAKNWSTILKGISSSPGQAYGPISVVKSVNDVLKVNEGDILVTSFNSPELVPAMRKCAGIVGLPECGGRTGHMAIASRAMGIPCVLRVPDFPLAVKGQAYIDGTTGEVKICVET